MQPSLAERTGAADAIHGPQTEVMTKNLMRMALSMPDRPARVPGPEEEPLFVQLPKNEVCSRPHQTGPQSVTCIPTSAQCQDPLAALSTCHPLIAYITEVL